MANNARKVVIITGAGSGIGQATALEFAKKAYNVVITGRTRSKLETTVDMCKAEGLTDDNLLVAVADVTIPEDNQRVIDNTLHNFGRMNVLVNNAGIASSKRFEEVTMEHLDLIYNSHVRSVFDLTQKAMPHLLKTKGNVITVSSILGELPKPGCVCYSMMKACVDHFTRAISVEYAPKGVRINTVNPGYVKTNIFDWRYPGVDKDAIFGPRGKALPIGKCLEPHDAAGVIVFLASDEASFITGANIPIDGAWRNTMTNL